MLRLVPATFFLMLVADATGCSLVLAPGEPQCETAVDCEARGFAGALCQDQVCQAPTDPAWGCLGHVVEPSPDPSRKVSLSVRLVYAVDKSPAFDASVDVCDMLDVQCTGSDPAYPKKLTPKDDGTVTLSLFQGFNGFIRVTTDDAMPSRIYVGRPMFEAPSIHELRLLRPTEYELIAATAQQKVDPSRGTAIVLALNCERKEASGVHFETPSADASSTEFYLIGQSPVTPPAADATDVDGFGGFFNLPAGLAVVRSYRADSGVAIGESSLHILAGTISYVQVAPTPQ